MEQPDTTRANVIPFPPRLRVVSAVEGEAPTKPVERPLVEHAGQAYQLADLLTHLSTAHLMELKAAAPRTGQETWDEVVRRWPALADLIVAGCQPALP